MINIDKIGSDPEFGILSKENEPIPSYLFFEGTKDTPEMMGNGFAILKDNLLVEGNIPACNNETEFVDSMKFLKDLIKIVLNQSEAKLVSEDELEYSQQYIFTPDGQEFGCSAFRNAYKRGMIQTPELQGLKRQLGMHVHISYDITDTSMIKTKPAFNRIIAKAMDYFVGIPSDQVKYSEDRRGSYGALGSYRDVPAYGMEYRSLGGFFTQDKYLPWIYKQTIKAIDFCKDETNVNNLMQTKEASVDNYEFLNIKLNEQIPG